jgi:hypothetical protein
MGPLCFWKALCLISITQNGRRPAPIGAHRNWALMACESVPRGTAPAVHSPVPVDLASACRQRADSGSLRGTSLAQCLTRGHRDGRGALVRATGTMMPASSWVPAGLAWCFRLELRTESSALAQLTRAHWQVDRSSGWQAEPRALPGKSSRTARVAFGYSPFKLFGCLLLTSPGVL